MRTDWNVPRLDPAEKDAAVAAILDAGLPQPFHWRECLTMLSPSTLFAGVEDSVFLAVLLTGLFCLAGASLVAEKKMDAAPLLFLLSPALFAALQALTGWKERANGMAEWRQTFRVSFSTMTALRMLIFGGTSVAVVVPFSVLVWVLEGQRIPLSWLVGLACSSLFFYAALSLFRERFHHRLNMLDPKIVWLVLALAAIRWPAVGDLLLTVPAWAFFLIAAGCSALWARELKHLIICSMRGEIKYAVR